MDPGGNAEYHDLAILFTANTKAFAYVAPSPPTDSIVASKLITNSLGSDSPSNITTLGILKPEGHSWFCRPMDSGDSGSLADDRRRRSCAGRAVSDGVTW